MLRLPKLPKLPLKVSCITILINNFSLPNYKIIYMLINSPYIEKCNLTSWSIYIQKYKAVEKSCFFGNRVFEPISNTIQSRVSAVTFSPKNVIPQR